MEQLNATQTNTIDECFVANEIDVDVTEFATADATADVDDEAVTLRSNSIAKECYATLMTNFENDTTDDYTGPSLADLVQKLDSKASELRNLISEAEEKLSIDFRRLICPICLSTHARKHQNNCELLALIKEANRDLAMLVTEE